MEAELDALLVNFRIGSAMRMLLTDMVHAQLHTPALTDSTIGDGFSNDNIRQQRSRSIDMRFYWVGDIVTHVQFLVYFMSGKHNLAEYFTKHHSTSHHLLKRITYLFPTVNASKYACYMSPNDLVGCVESLTAWGNGQ